jgi:hypothetical protein
MALRELLSYSQREALEAVPLDRAGLIEHYVLSDQDLACFGIADQDVENLICVPRPRGLNRTMQETGNVGNLLRCLANFGIPPSGRPFKITGPILFPPTSSMTSTDSRRSGPPSPPLACAPWQKLQVEAKIFCPRSAAACSTVPGLAADQPLATSSSMPAAMARAMLVICLL